MKSELWEKEMEKEREREGERKEEKACGQNYSVEKNSEEKEKCSFPDIIPDAVVTSLTSQSKQRNKVFLGKIKQIK